MKWEVQLSFQVLENQSVLRAQLFGLQQYHEVAR